jgi:hypothetical protein
MAQLRAVFVAALLVLALFVVVPKPAHAAANSSVQGSGSTTQLLCPSGQLLPATISFNATKSKGVVSGFGQIFGAAVVKDFTLNGGTIGTNSYSLTGATEFVDMCGTFASTLPQQVSLSGQCGTGVTIYYTDTAGETGTFIGNVVCS